jgi:VanZ family protein
MISATVLTRVWWGLGFVLVAASLVICLVPGQELPTAFEFNDKLSHIVGHGGLALWFAGLVPRRSWWKIFVALLAFGICIEFAQYFMHFGREADARDVVANSCGALLGLGLSRLGLSRWPDWAAWLLGQRRVVE